MSPGALDTFANELQDLREGRVQIEVLWNRYLDLGDFETILSFVQHYVADADIRAKDSTYRAMQEESFDRLLELLRAGRIREAKRVTFLRPFAR